ncbi:MAG: hypothetical protein ACTSPA_12920 [Promethearchaeota archaeon]
MSDLTTRKFRLNNKMRMNNENVLLENLKERVIHNSKLFSDYNIF